MIKKNKDIKYKSAPLSFPGHKRTFRDEYLGMISDEYDDSYIFVDLFGGSGYLSYLTHIIYPKAHVIYNDFDHYADRIKNIKMTNEIMGRLRDIFKGIQPQSKLNECVKAQVIEALEDYESRGCFVDYESLSCNLCFSNRIMHDLDGFRNDPLYNRVRKNNYDECEDYLDGLEIVSMDYREL